MFYRKPKNRPLADKLRISCIVNCEYLGGIQKIGADQIRVISIRYLHLALFSDIFLKHIIFLSGWIDDLIVMISNLSILVYINEINGY